MQDHYEVLQIPRDASVEDIQRAYRTLALKFHPDRNTAPEAAAQMAAINQAYEMLHDRGRRRAYDRRRKPGMPKPELAAPILDAARDVIRRSGWAVVEEEGGTFLLGKGKHRVRVFFTDRVTNETLRKLLRRSGSHDTRELTLILAMSIEGSIQLAFQTVALDLMRGNRYGAASGDDPEGLFKTLLAGFL